MLLYFVRHGDPIYNPDQLTEKGHIQAEALSKRFALTGLDEIYASTSTRAIQTAEPTAAKLGKEIKLLDWCNEKYAWQEFSCKEGDRVDWFTSMEKYLKILYSDEVRNLGFEWYKHPAFGDMDCENGMKRISQNSDEFLKSLGYEHDFATHTYKAIEPNEKKIALFAHAGFSRAFLSSVLDIPYPCMSAFIPNHSGVTVIRFQSYDDGTAFARLVQYSNDSHFYKEGLPTVVNNSFLV